MTALSGRVAHLQLPDDSVVKEPKAGAGPNPQHRSEPQLPSHRNGGGKRIRTADPLLAKQVLFQLSYTPRPAAPRGVVGLGRFELPTSPLSGARSSQLSYRPDGTRLHRASPKRDPGPAPVGGPMFAQN